MTTIKILLLVKMVLMGAAIDFYSEVGKLMIAWVLMAALIMDGVAFIIIWTYL
jgi:uncharacterized membrane protein